MLNIDELRKEIDAIDRELVSLFERRMAIVSDIALYKLENNMEVFDRGREEALLEKTSTFLKNQELKGDLEIFFKNMMDISKGYQRRKIGSSIPNNSLYEKKEGAKVAYQGVPGSFSYSALKKYFGEDMDGNNFYSFEEVFDAVERGEMDYGVIPFENSSTGTIKDNYDFIREKNVYIVGEIRIPVKHNIVARKGTSLAEIDELYSHPQAFDQSSIYLKGHNFKLIPYKNTALSAEYVSKSDEKIGAICSREAALLYNLEILEEEINDTSENYTRFIIISKNIKWDENSNKISITFSTLHKAGELLNIIEAISKREINMMSIKSIPILEKPWEYFFYIDISGNMNDKNIKAAIEEIENKSHFFKLLGNYLEVR
jgi:chorismate mutase/prephenate dehydratase